MKKIFDNTLFTSFDIKHVHRRKIDYYKRNKKWQCIKINEDFESNYQNKLDKSKKILILGDWRRNTVAYRFLKSRNYKVYLERK